MFLPAFVRPFLLSFPLQVDLKYILLNLSNPLPPSTKCVLKISSLKTCSFPRVYDWIAPNCSLSDLDVLTGYYRRNIGVWESKFEYVNELKIVEELETGVGDSQMAAEFFRRKGKVGEGVWRRLGGVEVGGEVFRVVMGVGEEEGVEIMVGLKGKVRCGERLTTLHLLFWTARLQIIL